MIKGVGLLQQTENSRLEEIQQLKEMNLQQTAYQVQQLDSELQQKNATLKQKDTEIQRLQEQIEMIQVNLA